MYYDERKINGVWMWHSTPNGDWQRFTPEGRRWRMRADLLAMADRAVKKANAIHWAAPEGGRRAFRAFAAECNAFAAELQQEAQQ